MRPTLPLLALMLSGLTLPAFAQSASQKVTYGQQQQSKQVVLDEVAFVVNERALSKKQLSDAMKRELALLPKGVGDSEQRSAQALENLIMWNILEQLAVRLEVGVDHQEVQAAEQSIARSNGLSVAALHQKVQRETGLDANTFRIQLARGLLEDKLKYGLLGDKIEVREAEINDQMARLARHQGTLLHVQDILLPMPAGDAFARAPQIHENLRQVSDALQQAPNNPQQAVANIPQAQFNDLGQLNLARIQNVFTRVLLNLPVGEVSPVPVADADGLHFLRVVDRHNDQSGSYRIQEYRAAHILIKHTPSNDEIAQAKVRAVISALQSGQDFATVARRYSEDSVSAAAGGELGWVNADILPPEVSAVLSQLPVKTLSPVVNSPAGYHILLTHEQRNANRNEAMIRAGVREFLFEKALQEAWSDYLSDLRSNAYIKTF